MFKYLKNEVIDPLGRNDFLYNVEHGVLRGHHPTETEPEQRAVGKTNDVLEKPEYRAVVSAQNNGNSNCWHYLNIVF